jgi:hypothetical protein
MTCGLASLPLPTTLGELHWVGELCVVPRDEWYVARDCRAASTVFFIGGAIPIRLGLAPGLEDWTEYGKLSAMVGEGGHASIRRVVRAPAHLVRTAYEVL